MRATLFRQLARASARNGTATARAAAAAPQSWRHLATSPLATDAVNLDLSQAKALTCHNMMCEHVGEPCGCRIAAFLERRSFPKLETLSLRGAGLRAVPDAVLRLPLLRELDLSRNELLRALPDDLAALESLETLDVTETALEALPPRLFALPRLRRVAADAELLVAPAGWTAPQVAVAMTPRELEEALDARNRSRLYYATISASEGRRQAWIRDDLPFLAPLDKARPDDVAGDDWWRDAEGGSDEPLSAHFFMRPGSTRRWKGINCRFGMRGINAAAHFDGSRNFVAIFGGFRR